MRVSVAALRSSVTLLGLVACQALARAQTSPERELFVYLKPPALAAPGQNVTLFDPGRIQGQDIAARLASLAPDTISVVGEEHHPWDDDDSLRVYMSPTPGPGALDFTRMLRVRLALGVNPDSAASLLRASSDVEFVDRNVGIVIRMTPNDPEFQPRQWNLNNTGQTGGTAGADIDAPGAWDAYQGHPLVRVGIIDVGFADQAHSELSNRVFAGGPPDFHATHIAGIIGATGNNGAGLAGIDWRCRIESIAANIQDANDVYNYMVLCINRANKLVNISWGQRDDVFSDIMESAFVYVFRNNGLAICAMPEPSSPSDYPNAYRIGIMNVNATTSTDAAAPYTLLRSFVDISAPGGAGTGSSGNWIFSTAPKAGGVDQYAYAAGTSFAAPHVVGVGALLSGYAADVLQMPVGGDDLFYLLRYGVDDKGDAGHDPYFGYGRLNADKSLQLLRPPYRLQKMATGGDVVSVSESFNWSGYSIPGLAAGNYIAKRHTIERTVEFPIPYAAPPYAWTRRIEGVGWDLSNPNRRGLPWAEIVPGSVTATSCRARTYVYELRDIQSHPVGYYPCTPQQAVMAISATGLVAPLSVSIAGPGTLNCSEQGLWTGIPLSGFGAISYAWQRRLGSGSWSDILSTSSTYGPASSGEDVDVRVIVQRGSETAQAIKHVTYGCSTGGGGGGGGGYDCEVDPQLCSEEQPNNSRPIWSGNEMELVLHRGTELEIVLYDINGRVIARMYEGYLGAGRHLIPGRHGLKQGVYFIKMVSPTWRKNIRTIVLANR